MKFLILQHLAIEGPALIGEMLEQAGHSMQSIELWHQTPQPDALQQVDGLIIMGGPMSADDEHASIGICLSIIRQAMSSNLPILGICLGAQLMAKAAGAGIESSPVRELGWHPVYPTDAANDDPLFGSLAKNGLRVFQWHGETFTLPDSATLLASHPDVPHQAFRLEKGQYGLQFHIEVDMPIIEKWIAAGEREREYLGSSGLAQIRLDAPAYLAAMQAFCRRMIQAWLAVLHTGDSTTVR